jgi:hypothetical protein
LGVAYNGSDNEFLAAERLKVMPKNNSSLLDQLAASLPELDGVESGQMFGKPCLKVGGKAFAALFKDADMAFKLSGDAHAAALKLAGACLWDPSGKGRPMKEWVLVPAKHRARWKGLAEEACAYVRECR